jgi:hypothetical protein
VAGCNIKYRSTDNCKSKSIDLQIKEIKWKWMGHTVRGENSTARDALIWNPQGKRKAGRLRNTWRRTILNLNSVKQLIFVMVKCGVLFEVRAGFLNNI